MFVLLVWSVYWISNLWIEDNQNSRLNYLPVLAVFFLYYKCVESMRKYIICAGEKWNNDV